MNLRKEKGSIAIFVLVALLFMASFLIILYASNVNKSKVVKEQFDIISDIYAHGGGDETAYDKAYNDLRIMIDPFQRRFSEWSLKIGRKKYSPYRIY